MHGVCGLPGLCSYPGKGKAAQKCWGRSTAAGGRAWGSKSKVPFAQNLWENVEGERCKKCGGSENLLDYGNTFSLANQRRKTALARSPSRFIAEPKPVIKLKKQRKKKYSTKSIKKSGKKYIYINGTGNSKDKSEVWQSRKCM